MYLHYGVGGGRPDHDATRTPEPTSRQLARRGLLLRVVQIGVITQGQSLPKAKTREKGKECRVFQLYARKTKMGHAWQHQKNYEIFLSCLSLFHSALHIFMLPCTSLEQSTWNTYITFRILVVVQFVQNIPFKPLAFQVQYSKEPLKGSGQMTCSEKRPRTINPTW